jgi:DNA-binding FadR family transcriptional regulator
MQHQGSSTCRHTTIAVNHHLLLCDTLLSGAAAAAAAAVWQHNACFLQDLLLLRQRFQPIC